jgi:hypothetical protein
MKFFRALHYVGLEGIDGGRAPKNEAFTEVNFTLGVVCG